MVNSTTNVVLSEKLVSLGNQPKDKINAIHMVGQLLVDSGIVDDSFIASMEKREQASNTYLGSGIAIPHGLVEDKGLIRQDAIAVLQVPEGVEWKDGQKATLIIAIAATSDSHIEILKRLTRLLQKSELIQQLSTTDNVDDIIHALLDTPKVNDQPHNTQAEMPKDKAHSFEWVVDYPSGLHARPSSTWASSAEKLGLSIQVRHGYDIADAQNMVELLQLGLKMGDTVVISADGDQAEIALQQFKQSVTALTRAEKEEAERAKISLKVRKLQGWQPKEEQTSVQGVMASPGFVIGQSYHLSSTLPEIKDEVVPLAQAGQILERALADTKTQMNELIESTTQRLSAKDAEIFKAQVVLLSDSSLVGTACQYMVEGHGVAWSWHQAVEERAQQLSSSSNALLAERAIDLRDIGRRVLGHIDPLLKYSTLADLPEGEWILTAEDLSPSDTILLNPDQVKGLVTIFGGPTSHTAILARTLGIPAIVAAGETLAQVNNDTTMIVDADGAAVYIDPSDVNLESAREWIEQQNKKRAEEEASKKQPATTPDGHSVMVAANVNKADQLDFAAQQGAEGVGLMRTEFIFLERHTAPTEDEQYQIYKEMMDGLHGQPLIIRTLDIGGDKQVEYLHLPHEDNPFLGVRGIRLLLRRVDLLLPQLRALYRAAKTGSGLSIMFPMITSVSDVIALKKYCETVRQSLDAPVIPIGIMIEVPAAAMMADIFAEHVDFFSIGTNDLTQYTLAIDRQNPELAAEADSLHPAVLRLIQKTVEGAKKYNKHVGVCGGLAGDPLGAMILTGLGIDELSMTPRDIPSVKSKIRMNTLASMQKLAQDALSKENASEVRALIGEMK